MGFSLLIREGHGAGETLRFDQPEVTFGRVTDNDVVLYDPDVSRKHFSIVLEGDCYVLKDLGSSNGTQLNGEMIDAYPLSSGDEIQVGQMIFEFKAGAPRRNLPAKRQRSRERAPAEARGGKGGAAKHSAPPAVRGGGAMSARRDARSGGAMATSGGGSARERFKARKAAATPMGKAKLWYGGLAPKRRLMLNVGGGVGLLLVVLMVLASVGGDEPLVGPRDLSGRELRYEPEMGDWAFGYGFDDVSHQARSSLGFQFPYADGRVTIIFDVGFVEGGDEVEIRLNDERLVGYAPVSIGTWVRDVEMVLPHNGLRQNSMNTIVFDQVRNPGSSPPATWGIRNLRIREDPLPSPNPRRAEERFELAEQRWQNREISPRNIYDACRNYREARDYLELIEVKPPLYDEVNARISECSSELETIYRRLVFEAQRHERYRQWEQAQATLMQGLEFFPDETDPRHMTLQNWLQSY